MLLDDTHYALPLVEKVANNLLNNLFECLSPSRSTWNYPSFVMRKVNAALLRFLCFIIVYQAGLSSSCASLSLHLAHYTESAAPRDVMDPRNEDHSLSSPSSSSESGITVPRAVPDENTTLPSPRGAAAPSPEANPATIISFQQLPTSLIP